VLLTFDGNISPSLSDDDIHTLAVAWPNLRHLGLTFGFSRRKALSIWDHSHTGPSVQALRSIALQCPSLISLTIALHDKYDVRTALSISHMSHKLQRMTLQHASRMKPQDKVGFSNLARQLFPSVQVEFRDTVGYR